MSGVDVRHPGVVVQLTGLDGNAFAIMGRVRHALRAKVDATEVERFIDEAVASSSYDELLRVVMRWVEVR